MPFSDILAQFTPLTLTESVNLIKTNEPLVLTEKLGKNQRKMLDEVCVYEVEEGNYRLAPLGYSSDPASNVNVSHKITPYAVTPPQIFLQDRITASEVNKVRLAAQNPINMTKADKTSAFNELIAVKQQGLIRLVNRSTEWLFGQALNGKIDYTSATGRVFKHDYNLAPADNREINGEYWNKASDPGNPIHQLRRLAKLFRERNNQLAPDLIIMGGAAGDAFLDNPHVEDWLKSPGVQIMQLKAPLAKGEAMPIATLQGAEIFEYSATYENNKGKATPYIDEDSVYLTNSTLWRLFYGAINDFDAGNPPITARAMFSKLKISQDGKAMDLYVESHPMPVMVSNACVVKAKVVD